MYKDMRTPGQYERFYRDAQDHPLNFFTKGEVASVKPGRTAAWPSPPTTPCWANPSPCCVDLVVLATGMVPNGTERILNLAYRQGPELPVLQTWFPGFPLHLLPL